MMVIAGVEFNKFGTEVEIGKVEYKLINIELRLN